MTLFDDNITLSDRWLPRSRTLGGRVHARDQLVPPTHRKTRRTHRHNRFRRHGSSHVEHAKFKESKSNSIRHISVLYRLQTRLRCPVSNSRVRKRNWFTKNSIVGWKTCPVPATLFNLQHGLHSRASLYRGTGTFWASTYNSKETRAARRSNSRPIKIEGTCIFFLIRLNWVDCADERQKK